MRISLPTGNDARTRRPLRLLAAGLTVTALPMLTGCGAGFSAAVDKVKADNASGEAHGLLARAIVIVKGREAVSAAMAGTLINRSSKGDVLETITLTDQAPGSQPITLSPNLTLNPGQLIPLGTGANQPLTIPDAHTLNVGDFVDVVMHFRDAGDIKLTVATADRTYFYSDVLPGSTGAANQGDTSSKATTKKATTTSKVSTAPTAASRKARTVALTTATKKATKATAAKPTAKAKPAVKATAKKTAPAVTKTTGAAPRS